MLRYVVCFIARQTGLQVQQDARRSVVVTDLSQCAVCLAQVVFQEYSFRRYLNRVSEIDTDLADGSAERLKLIGFILFAVAHDDEPTFATGKFVQSGVFKVAPV